MAALHALYGIESRTVPPLTVVLFRSDRLFAPYKPVTESGKAKRVAGLFSGRDGWSVMGLGKDRSREETRRLIQHEATHWFLSGSAIDYPIWFEEGYAQAMSTFVVQEDQGLYGRLIPDHVAYLNRHALEPFDAFFRVDRDAALHDNPRFYPQAWAFVHYGLFSDDIARGGGLSTFLKLQRTTPTREAFEAAFGMTFDEFERSLSRYLRGGGFKIVAMKIGEIDAEFPVETANETQVEAALGRLAIVGGNAELAKRKADSLITGQPDSPVGFGLAAYTYFDLGDSAAASKAASKSIALGSQDGGIHLLEASLRFERQRDGHATLDTALPESEARAIADLVLRGEELGVRTRRGQDLLNLALMNVSLLSERDVRHLDDELQQRPNYGMPVLVKAAHANRRGDYETARSLVRDARTEPRRLPALVDPVVSFMTDRWLFEYLAGNLERADSLADLDAVDALLNETASRESLSAQLDKALLELRSHARSYRRHLEAVRAVGEGDIELARARWQETVDDPLASVAAKRDAQRALQGLGQLRGP